MNEPTDPARRPVAQWLPAAAAAGLVGTVVVAGVALGGSDDGAAPAPVTAVAQPAPPSSDESAAPTTTTGAAAVAETPPTTAVDLERTLVRGVTGDDVADVQQRLTDLGFVPGPVDGIYGDETIRAVWAFEKLVMGAPSASPSGEVTPQMWEAMREPFTVEPRRPNSTPDHTEVYLPEQVLAVFHDDVPVIITHMSSGTGEEWCEEVTISPGEYGNRDGTEELKRGECGRSDTPGGVFEFYREVEGIRESALGSMWDPSYFNYGIAIHGAMNVPLQPASHGCIRVPLNISETVQGLIDLGDQVFVWDGVKEPEEYGDQPPTFNWLDPDYVSTTTTTVPESTTTVPEPTATVAESTTTVAVTAPPATAPATTTPPATPAPSTAPPTTTAPTPSTAAPTTSAPTSAASADPSPTTAPAGRGGSGSGGPAEP
ncbi:L,D-transpeptidase family protein [Ilumatobacter sp.]|uniref:L,D-transpeptidase family protein n=1 Tax=Ilumatobacter sp. TaxID=1967498 RepID=UPI003B518FA8